MFAPRVTRLLKQLCIFLLIVANLEMWCAWRLRAEGLETGTGIAQLDADAGWLIKEDRERTLPRAGEKRFTDEVDPQVVDPQELRVICIGGSVVWGAGVSDPFEVPLQALLNARCDKGKRVRVINAGVDGFDSFRSLGLLMSRMERYRPQVVLVMWGRNDDSGSWSYRLSGGGPRPSWADRNVIRPLRNLLYKSATYRYLMRRLLDHAPDDAASRWHRSVESSADNLRYLSECVKGQAAVVFAIEASRHGRPSQAYEHLTLEWTRIAAETGMAFIDLNRVFRDSGLSDDELFLANDKRHPNPRGHEIYARALAAPVMSQAPEFFSANPP